MNPRRPEPSKHVRTALAAALVLIGGMSLLAAQSCSQSVVDAPVDQSDDGDAQGPTPTGQGATTGSGAAPPDGSVPDASHGPCEAPAPQVTWTPPENGWSPVAWANACSVETASNPVTAMPPLEWAPCCDALPGCSHLVPSWAYLGPYPWMRASVVKWGSGYRIGLVFRLDEQGSYIAGVYDENGTALVAWRTRGHEYCVVSGPEVTTERVWIGFNNTEVSNSQTFVGPTWNELAIVSATLPIDFVSQWRTVDSTLGGFWLLDGRSLNIVDLDNSQVYSYGAGNTAYGFPEVHGDYVVARSASALDQLQASVWSRATRTMHVVVEPTFPDRVANVNTDGQTLAWVVQPSWEQGGHLWTSPLADTKGGLAPVQRRAAPVLQGHGSEANDGYYAVYSKENYPGEGPGDNRVHVYRLSDAHHWSFAFPSSWTFVSDIDYVDATTVFFSPTGALARQSIAALGPGDAAP